MAGYRGGMGGSYNVNGVSVPWAKLGSGIPVKATEPLQSRADDYKSPGDNSSPAGQKIPAGIGTRSYNGKIVYFAGFTPARGPVTDFVMLFKDCLFADSFSLIQMFADEQILISNKAPLRQSPQKIRFYDGSQTTPDTLLVSLLGEDEASVWPGYVYAVFEDFDCSRYGNHVPLIRAVLAGSVTQIAAAEERSSLTFGTISPSYEPNYLAVDRARNHAYVFYWANVDDDGAISVVDITTNAEISRATIKTTNYSLLEYMVALDGTDYLVATGFETSGNQYYDILLVNAYTGEVVDRLEALLDGVFPFEAIPHSAAMIESGSATKFLVLTQTINSGIATGSYLGALLVDVTNGTLEWVVHPYTNSLDGEGEPYAIAIGPVAEGAVTVYFTGHDGTDYTVRKAVISSSGATSELVYSEAAVLVNYPGVAYDATDDRIVVYRTDGTFRKIDENGVTAYTSAATEIDLVVNFKSSSYVSFTYSARPGYVICARGNSGGDVYQIDLSDGSSTLLIDKSDFLDEGLFGYFDQFSGVYVEETFEATGCINKITLGDSTPDTVDLVDFFTQIAAVRGFAASDLTFTGFPGNEITGWGAENDTTLSDIEKTHAEVFEVRIVPSDGGRKYIFPPRDGSFAINHVLSEEDFVEKGTDLIEKTEGAGEEEFIGCTIQYHDVDSNYEKLPATYNRPIGVYNVSRSRKTRDINTGFAMTASQAMKQATLITFRSIFANVNYGGSLVPGWTHAEPGDICSFPFHEFTVVGRIKEATLNSDYTQDVQFQEYLQYEDATFTGAGLTIPDETEESLFMRLIYLDIPLLSYSHDLGGAGLRQYAQIAGYGDVSITGTIFKSPDGSTFTSQGSRVGISPIIGVVTAISGTPSDTTVTDRANTLAVLVGSGDIDDLASITEAQLYANANLAAVGAPGRWVLVAFQTVSASSGTATLSNLIWGVNGSEVWVDDLAVGDQFVLLDSSNYTKFQNTVAQLDDTIYYKAANPAVPLGSVVTEVHVAEGVAEIPYAATELEATVDGTDIDFSWEYRERLDPMKVLTGQESAGYSESALSFSIDIMDAGSPDTVVRTLTSSTNSVTYTAAQITTDFGTMPDSITWRVYQISATVVRGHRAEKTSQLALAISGTPVLTATEDAVYAGFTVSADGGTAPYTFSISSGTLPAGILLNSATGTLSGTPTESGTFADIIIRVTDAALDTDDLAGFTLTVEAAAASQSITLTDERSVVSSSVTKTFSTVDLGDESADRIILVAITGNSVFTHQVSTVTIGGVSATLVQRVNNSRSVALYYAAVPTGATGTVVVVFSTTEVGCRMSVAAVYGVAATIHDSDVTTTGLSVTTRSLTIDVPAGGIAFAAGIHNATATASWTGLTEFSENQQASTHLHATAADVFASIATPTITATYTVAGTSSLVALSFDAA